jgi:hypothetical protein
MMPDSPGCGPGYSGKPGMSFCLYEQFKKSPSVAESSPDNAIQGQVVVTG